MVKLFISRSKSIRNLKNLFTLSVKNQLVLFLFKGQYFINYLLLQKLVASTVRFRFDGQPVTENDTPQGLEMEDGDTIEVFQQQTGGKQL